jgi:hypothetical protein
MDNVMTLYHGGSVEEDQFENVSFVGIWVVLMMSLNAIQMKMPS